jgi:hypothetical protein
VQCHERVTLESFVVLLVCIQIVEDDLQARLCIVRNDFIHEVEKAAAFLVDGPDLTGGDLESGTMPFVVVAVPCQGASVRQFQ